MASLVTPVLIAREMCSCSSEAILVGWLMYLFVKRDFGCAWVIDVVVWISAESCKSLILLRLWSIFRIGVDAMKAAEYAVKLQELGAFLIYFQELSACAVYVQKLAACAVRVQKFVACAIYLKNTCCQCDTCGVYIYHQPHWLAKYTAMTRWLCWYWVLDCQLINVCILIFQWL